ncbi:MAG: zinc ribbon domain-containing protein [Azoarcus sp.]|nr:zinc ribbon domain-containing protein [Azoarcus sp.]
MQCTTCGHENRDGSAFCSYCGEHLNNSPSPAVSLSGSRSCPGCGSVCTREARFCPACGTALKVFDAPPPFTLSPQHSSLETLGELDLPWTRKDLADHEEICQGAEDWSVEPTVMFDPAPETEAPFMISVAPTPTTPAPAAPPPAAPTSSAPPTARLATREETPKGAAKKAIEKRNLLVGTMLGLVLLGGGMSFWAYWSISDGTQSVPPPAVSMQAPDSPPPFVSPNDADAIASAPVDAVLDIDAEGDLSTAAPPSFTDTAPASAVAAAGPQDAREDAAVGRGRVAATAQANPRPSARPAARATASSRQTESWLGALRQDLSLCSQLGFFARISCREKARWKYCNDRWDTVPECAVGARANP